MIRCPKHGIDKDVCDCIDYTSQDYDNAYPKSTILTTWVGFMFFLILLALMVGAASCNSQKRALKHVQKAVRIDQPTVNKYFADNYSITDSVNIKTIYKQGETVTDTVTEIEIEYINDTIVKTETKKVFITRVDSVFMDRYEREQNNAVVKSLQDDIALISSKLYDKSTALEIAQNNLKRVKANNTKIGIIIAVYLAIKVLMMWLGTRLPVNGVFNVIRKIF